VFELIVAIAAVILIYMVADYEETLRPGVWAGVAVLAIVASIAMIPLPFARVGIALVATFILMMAWKARSG
jgi:hypothetical protein